jgi:hypothetical protein
VKKTLIISTMAALVAIGTVASVGESSAMTQAARDEKLAAVFNLYATPWTIAQRIRNHPNSDISIDGPYTPQSYDPLPRKGSDTPDFLTRIAVANASLVVEGTPVSERCLPIKSNRYLFTEYAVRVDRVHFDKTHEIKPGSTIILAREGGVTQMNGVTIRAGSAPAEPLIRGTKYFFALRAIPDTDAYISDSKSIFELNNGIVRPVSGRDRVPQHTKSEGAFRSELSQILREKH